MLLAQQIWKNFDGSKTSPRKDLPLGVQDLLQLDWDKQNHELSPVQEQFDKVAREQGLDALSEFQSDDQGRKLLWRGLSLGFLVLVDGFILKDVGLIRYQMHTFDSGMS